MTRDNAVQKLSRIFFMTFRSISARLLPNARTAFTSDLFKKIPRRRDFRRYLFLSPPLPSSFFSLTPYRIDFFFFLLSILFARYVHDRESLTGVSLWNTKRDGNHEGLYGDGIKAYSSTRESSRKRKSRWLIRGERKRIAVPQHRAKVNNSRFFLCDSQTTGVAFRRSTTLNQRQFYRQWKENCAVSSPTSNQNQRRFESLGN